MHMILVKSYVYHLVAFMIQCDLQDGDLRIFELSFQTVNADSLGSNPFDYYSGSVAKTLINA
jgi:hypothetical protein